MVCVPTNRFPFTQVKYFWGMFSTLWKSGGKA